MSTDCNYVITRYVILRVNIR